MLDHVWGGAIRREAHKRSRGGRPPRVESLEGRQLLAASLAPIAPISVPATLGYQLPLDGSGAGVPQTYTVTSSNPDIKATVTQGKFLTLTVTHNAAAGNASDISFSGNITFQLFDDLTPKTTAMIEQFVTSGFYTQTGNKFHRVASGFPGTSDFIVQGGSASGNGSGSSGLAGTPFADEFNQQLAFTGQFQLAMANAGPDTNDTQFFITTGSPQFLNFKHTIFGQVVSGQNIVEDMTKVAVQNDPTSGADTSPVSPLTITNAVITNTNPDGVIHIDATKATAGETASVTVTATDPSTNTTATQTVPVTVAADANAPQRPFVQPVPNMTVGLNQSDVFQIPAVSPTPGDQLTYTVDGGVTTSTGTTGTTTTTFTPVQNATATVDQTTGIVTVVPTTGFSGTIPLLVGVRDQVNRSGAAQTEDPSNYDYHQITLTVNSSATPITLSPIALASTVNASANTPQTVQLTSNSAMPASSPTLTYAITSQPTDGTISQFNASTGSFVYTPTTGFTGTDQLQFTVTNTSASPNVTSAPATVSINVQQDVTGAVRMIGNVLVISPPVQDAGKANSILVSEVTNASDSTQDALQVTFDGVIDRTQPLVSNVDRIVIYGTKGNDSIGIDPSVDPSIPVTLDGGHGGKNVLQAGAGPTREHGWFGQNKLIGGTGPNQLVGRAGHVKLIPSSTTDEIFTGSAQPNFNKGRIRPPKGTFYKSVNGKLIPTNAAGTGTVQSSGGNENTSAAVHKTTPKTPHAPSTTKKK